MDQSLTRPSYLFFENKWILEQGFTNLVSGKWQEPKERRPETCYLVDAWHGSLCMIRQFLKGWGIKQAGEKKKSLFCMTYATNFYKSLFGSYDPSHLRPLAPTSRVAEQQQQKQGRAASKLSGEFCACRATPGGATKLLCCATGSGATKGSCDATK